MFSGELPLWAPVLAGSLGAGAEGAGVHVHQLHPSLAEAAPSALTPQHFLGGRPALRCLVHIRPEAETQILQLEGGQAPWRGQPRGLRVMARPTGVYAQMTWLCRKESLAFAFRR